MRVAAVVGQQRGDRVETARLWDPVTGSPVGESVTGHTGGVVAAAVPLPDGRTLLATGSHDATVRLWDPVIGAETARIIVGTPVYALTVCMSEALPSGERYLAITGVAGTAVLAITRLSQS
jgi:WD40 repeat protein